MIVKDPDSNDLHILLDGDVDIVQDKSIIIFKNKDETTHGSRKVYLTSTNVKDLDALAHSLLQAAETIQKMEIKKLKERYVSFSARVKYERPPSRQ